MAVKEVKTQKAEFNKATVITTEAVTTIKDGISFKLGETDEYTVILIENAGSATANAKVKAPTNGSYAAADTDITAELKAGEKAIVRIESAKYANNDGIVAIITSSTDVKVAIVD